MNKFKNILGRTKSISSRSGSRSGPSDLNNATIDSPEANAPRAICLFCESGSQNNGGDEVLHLPVIVESAESSPLAAASAAIQIKKFLSKDWSNKPHVQYNAIMLIRILSDNPGPTFTRNFDKSFVNTVKDLLRNCRDGSTQQLMRETLDHLENDKQHDQGLQGLLQMWRKEKGNAASFNNPQYSRGNVPAQGGRSNRSGGSLPNPAELASRVEEARNTAKILLQLVQSTPAEQIVTNELIREFSERCQSAQRSMQRYISADNPSPDHDTMQTLIETNEQLSLAMTRYQRAVLAGRRAMGASPSPPQDQQAAQTQTNGYGAFAPPAGPPPQQQNNGQTFAATTQSTGFFDQGQSYSGFQAPPGPPPSQRPTQGQQSNPFADPVPDNLQQPMAPTPHGAFASPQTQQSTSAPFAHSQTFAINSEPTFAQRSPTPDLENAYSFNQSQVSPAQTRGSINNESVVSPSSTYRPGAGATASYLGRQESAANGLTMHGANAASTPGTGTYNSSYDVSPIEARKDNGRQW